VHASFPESARDMFRKEACAVSAESGCEMVLAPIPLAKASCTERKRYAHFQGKIINSLGYFMGLWEPTVSRTRRKKFKGGLLSAESRSLPVPDVYNRKAWSTQMLVFPTVRQAQCASLMARSSLLPGYRAAGCPIVHFCAPRTD
jgi:hypothetical protein